MADLTNVVLEEWSSIPINTLLNLVESHPRKVGQLHMKPYGLGIGFHSYVCAYKDGVPKSLAIYCMLLITQIYIM